jgi:hypothetical protein
LSFSLSIGATGSHVPYASLIQIHAAFEPDATRAGLQDSARIYPEVTTIPGFDINYTLSAVHRRFAFARLSGSHLTESSSDFSAALTTIALNNRSLQRFESGS